MFCASAEEGLTPVMNSHLSWQDLLKSVERLQLIAQIGSRFFFSLGKDFRVFKKKKKNLKIESISLFSLVCTFFCAMEVHAGINRDKDVNFLLFVVKCVL